MIWVMILSFLFKGRSLEECGEVMNDMVRNQAPKGEGSPSRTEMEMELSKKSLFSIIYKYLVCFK